jgi:hypothetical protein
MKRTTISAMLLAMALAHPLSAQRRNNPPPPPDEEQAGTQDLPPRACPADFTDGPYYENGLPYHGISARKVVESFLTPPQDASDPWASVDVASLRVLTDWTDYTACQRLTTILTNGTRSMPPLRTWVYFTAGGFYFISQYKLAQPLSNYTTSYGHVMVFDRAFNWVGAYSF